MTNPKKSLGAAGYRGKSREERSRGQCRKVCHVPRKLTGRLGGEPALVRPAASGRAAPVRSPLSFLQRLPVLWWLFICRTNPAAPWLPPKPNSEANRCALPRADQTSSTGDPVLRDRDTPTQRRTTPTLAADARAGRQPSRTSRPSTRGTSPTGAGRTPGSRVSNPPRLGGPTDLTSTSRRSDEQPHTGSRLTTHLVATSARRPIPTLRSRHHSQPRPTSCRISLCVPVHQHLLIRC